MITGDRARGNTFCHARTDQARPRVLPLLTDSCDSTQRVREHAAAVLPFGWTDRRLGAPTHFDVSPGATAAALRGRSGRPRLGRPVGDLRRFEDARIARVSRAARPGIVRAAEQLLGDPSRLSDT